MEQKIFLLTLSLKETYLLKKLVKKKNSILKNMIVIKMDIIKMKVAILALQMVEVI